MGIRILIKFCFIVKNNLIWWQYVVLFEGRRKKIKGNEISNLLIQLINKY